MEEEGGLCQTCFAGTLQLTAGILVCETCGVTQQVGFIIKNFIIVSIGLTTVNLQNFLEETQEYQAATR